MKIRPFIYLLCTGVLLVAVAIIWFAKKPLQTSEQTSNQQLGLNPAASAMPPLSQPTTNKPLIITNLAGTPHLTMPVMQSNAKHWQEMMDTQNTVPIIFYGRLEDQYNNPIASARITGTAIIATGTIYDNTNVSTTSDVNGLFTLDAGKGQTLGIMAKKEGYAVATKNTSFDYSLRYPDHITPDPNNPIVIKMWKLKGTEQLVDITQTYKLYYTSERIFFDLVGKQIVQGGGDLEVIVTRAPGLITGRQQDHRDWSIKLIPVNGGIIEVEDSTFDFTFEAPADGYRDNYFVEMKHDSPAWFDNLVQKTFFLKSRNGQVYSKFSFDFRINDDPNGTMYFHFVGVANTNGSRNWEATAPQ
jgi:hypothetical protein